MNFVSQKSFICLVIFWGFVVCDAAITYMNQKIPAVLVFGDSVVDTGNNNNIQTPAKCNFPPYGRDFIAGKPTGRFSNGKVPSDFIAEAFGVKEILPAYLDPNLKTEDLLTGVVFASGGNGFDPMTNVFANAFTLGDQLNFFKEYKEKIKAAVGEERSSTIVSKSAYILCTGTNDLLNTYFGTLSLRVDINSYTDFLISAFSTFIKDLYGLGARRFGILSIPIIGCVPSQRTQRGGLQRNCFEDANKAALLFNSKLVSAISSLNSTLSGAVFLYFDIYNPLRSLIENPAKYGFEVANKGCCGTGKVEVTLLCNSFDDPLTCKDDTKYIFWDSFHPTETAYRTLVNMLLTDLRSML
ncbi:GDSL esterase/lipase EXL3-like [Euphorbia lathyris]|uniref:GDSL esterase/lipase EXL3-like n=1 Tax=Euphorbia lathyris TaxID=212925 RepID=UPI00331411BE